MNRYRPTFPLPKLMYLFITVGLASFVILGLFICLTMMCISYLKNKRRGPVPPKYPYLHLQMEDGEEEA